MNFYTDESNISCAVKYEWDFGDGTTSTEKNPFHIFNTSGVFNVRVKATNVKEEGSLVKSIVLDTNQAILSKFDFSVMNDNYHVPCKINCYNYSNFASEYYWDFGDGSTSTLVAPEHIYAASGTFTISLRSSCNTKQALFSKSIKVLPLPTTVAFTHFKVFNGSQELSSDKGTPLYMEMQYNNSNKMFSKIYLYKTYPVEWFFPDDIYSGSYKVSDAFLNADFFNFKLWLDDIATDQVLYTAKVDFDYLRSNYFPKEVYWESSGYRIGVSVSYP